MCHLEYPKCDVAIVDPKIYNFTNPDFIKTNFYDTPAYSVRIYFRNPCNYYFLFYVKNFTNCIRVYHKNCHNLSYRWADRRELQ